jgi:hypothetical protein
MFIIFSCNSDEKQHKEDIRNHRREKYNAFINSETSPIPASDIQTFSGLNYFDINMKYRCSAQLINKSGDKFEMIRSKGDTVLYDIAGELIIHLADSQYTLECYILDDSVYFLPFFDNTNGTETYGGGRYIDLPPPDKENYMVVDFNKAYNPYCCYNDKYTCPIPPTTNFINQKIIAGEKTFEH